MIENTQFKTLHCTRKGAVATVTLNRPEALNALNAAMMDDLDEAFSLLRSNAGIRVVLLTGSGERAFAAGADIRELLDTDSVSGKRTSERGQEVFSKIERCGKPVIACINGAALGGGLELALACTFRLAGDNANLGLPEAKLGLIPGFGGSQRLTRLIGRSAALRLMLTAQVIKADEALRVGLVDEVVLAAELMTRAQALAESIAALAPLAIAGVLEAVQQGEERPLSEGLQAETEIFGRLCGSADKQEGLSAFLEKRSPVWRSK